MGLVQILGQTIGIGGQIGAVLTLIGLRRAERGIDHRADPVGKPALQPHVQRQPGKDCYQHGRDQRHQREHRRQPQMQPRPGGFGAAVGHHPRHPRQNQCGHDQNIDQIGQQRQPQEQRPRPLGHRPQRYESGKGQHRAEHHQPDGRPILHPALPPQPVQPDPSAAAQGALHAMPSNCARPTARQTAPRVLVVADANGTRFCCGFTSICGGVSREYPDP